MLVYVIKNNEDKTMYRSDDIKRNNYKHGPTGKMTSDCGHAPGLSVMAVSDVFEVFALSESVA